MAVFELMPGDVALGRAGDQLKTLLGSCVSVILTDPRRTVGVMCHIVHVGHPNAANQNNTAFGAVAMAEMTRRLGSTPELFLTGGGASGIEALVETPARHVPDLVLRGLAVVAAESPHD